VQRFRGISVVLALLAIVATAPLGVGCGAGASPERDHPGREATVVHEERVSPRIVDLEIRSPALGTTAMVRLLTPDGWTAERRSRSWPVLYLLHGCCDSYESWTRSTDIEALEQLRKVLVVMPEAGAVGFYSNWHGTGEEPGPAWETFHLTEVRQLLERDYGAGPRRAVAGLSMGGLGAMGYAARHPGLFGAAASFSGLLHPLQHAGLLLGLFSTYSPDPRAIWGDPASDHAIWARHDPTELAERLNGIPLFVSAGNGRPGPLDRSAQGNDRIESTVLRESRAFVSRLRQLHTQVQADFYGPGTHAWPYFQRELERALPTLLPALTGPKPKSAR
jgi:diacylglycerol O-acyltransferase / trehalose O-mycolyltransferase